MIYNLNFDVHCFYNDKHKVHIIIPQINGEGDYLKEQVENAVRAKGWTYFSDGSQWCPACEMKYHGSRDEQEIRR
jgi:hypothetical protein